MFKGKVVAFALMLLFATSVFAGDVDDCTSDVGNECGVVALAPGLMKLNVCPFGDFELIRDACTGVGAHYLWTLAKDAAGNPIPGIPYSDYWINSCDALLALFLCANPIVADSLSGTNGMTTFQGRLAAGGCNIPAGTLTGQGIYMAIQGKVIKAKPACTAPKCVSVDVKSPDLTGAGGKPDGNVNLSDIVVFGTSYNTAWPGPYPPGKAFNACCDYSDDNTCNLSDFGFFGTHYLHKCQ